MTEETKGTPFLKHAWPPVPPETGDFENAISGAKKLVTQGEIEVKEGKSQRKPFTRTA